MYDIYAGYILITPMIQYFTLYICSATNLTNSPSLDVGVVNV